MLIHPKNIDAPVLVQELRVRMRGIKPFAIMFVYIAALCGVGLAVTTLSRLILGSEGNDTGQLGQILFYVLYFVQSVMIFLLVPAYSSGLLSKEREKGTFDLLALTSMSSNEIVTQKILAVTAQAGMLVLASMPITACALLMGGVSPMEIVMAAAVLVVQALEMAAFGAFCSSRMNTMSATCATYGGIIGYQMFLGGIISAAVFAMGINDIKLLYLPLVALVPYWLISRVLQGILKRAFTTSAKLGLYALIAVAMVGSSIIVSLSRGAGVWSAWGIGGVFSGTGPVPGRLIGFSTLPALASITIALGIALLLRGLTVRKVDALRRA